MLSETYFLMQTGKGNREVRHGKKEHDLCGLSRTCLKVLKVINQTRGLYALPLILKIAGLWKRILLAQLNK